MSIVSNPNDLYLGKVIKSPNEYNPEILQVIPRNNFKGYGFELWNLYELFWVNYDIPIAARGILYINRNSKFIVESKSLKLYLNSLNNFDTHCGSVEESMKKIQRIIEEDLSKALQLEVNLKIIDLNSNKTVVQPNHICLDEIFNPFSPFFADKSNEKSEELIYLNKAIKQNHILKIKLSDLSDTEETDEEKDENFEQYMTNIFGTMPKYVFYSNLSKSNCPVTNQPDFATLVIATDKFLKINHLYDIWQHLISQRHTNKFHETCLDENFNFIEQLIQNNLLDAEKNTKHKLLIFAHYLRRGGIDICPYRANYKLLDKINFNSAKFEPIYFVRQ